MNKYCIWKYFSNKEYGSEPFIFRYKQKVVTKCRGGYRYSGAKLLKIPSQDLIKNNRIKINEKGYCFLNVKTINAINAKPKFERFWTWYIKIAEFEAESDEEALLKYELREY